MHCGAQALTGGDQSITTPAASRCYLGPMAVSPIPGPRRASAYVFNPTNGSLVRTLRMPREDIPALIF